MLIWAAISLIIILMGMTGVAFITLLERKLLGLSQDRLGPNKVSFLGLFQPLLDGIKLLFKQQFYTLKKQVALFMLGPCLLFSFFLILWGWVLPWQGDFFNMKYMSLLFFSLLGMSTYAIVLTGWSSVSAYAKLGSMRGMLQSLSFEVALILIFFLVLSLRKAFLMKAETEAEVELTIFWCLMWFVLSLMETNRAPFDLLEGESELISGFNVEMSSVAFVFLFLSEYGMIMTLMLVMVISFEGGLNVSFILGVTLLMFMRSCFPRVRYDIMMSLMWISILPVIIFAFVFITFLF